MKAEPKKSVVFMGTPQFAVPTLQALLSGSKVVGIYSQPTALAGRGKKPTKSAVHQRADVLKIKVFTPHSFKQPDQVDALKRLNPDIIVVVAYGLILPREILSIPRLGCINVHASLLPQWRGASPIQQAIIAGDKTTGVTIMKMSEDLDAGDIIMQKSAAITPDVTAGTLSDVLSNLGADMVKAFMQSPEEYLSKAWPQDHLSATYTKKLKKSDGQITWDKPAEALVNKIRGLNPWPCAWIHVDGAYVKLIEAETVNLPPSLNACPSGMVVDCDFTVKCKDEAIVIKTLCPSGGKKMSGKAFLNGRQHIVHSII
ncbi:MAG: methionyl-tRNA formyltransferase [Holosporales bacterium]|nr:methionyl-tRNA formyltransferase [Holosporales bacterium]